MASKSTYEPIDKVNPSIFDANYTKYLYNIKSKLRLIGEEKSSLAISNKELSNHILLGNEQLNKSIAKKQQLCDTHSKLYNEINALSTEHCSCVGMYNDTVEQQQSLVESYNCMVKSYEKRVRDMIDEETMKQKKKEESSRCNKEEIHALENKNTQLISILSKKSTLRRELEEQHQSILKQQTHQLLNLQKEDKNIGSIVNKYGN